MKAFAALYARLDATTSTNAKLAALRDYFAAAAPADAAWAVYFLVGNRPRQVVASRLLRATATRLAALPDWLFDECYQAVGDLAETIALLLPPGQAAKAAAEHPAQPLSRWIEDRVLALRGLDEAAVQQRLACWWDELDASERFVFNKLVTGAFRVGVSRQLVTRALAQVASLPPGIIAERMAGQWKEAQEGLPTPQRYLALLAPEAGGPRARRDDGQPYPFFLAHPLSSEPRMLGDPADWIAEWKWDGIRAQLVRRGGRTLLWTRGEELVGERFPEVVAPCATLPDGTVLDGELLAWRDERPLPFAVLQRRIGRLTVGRKLLAEAPCAYVAYDLLERDGIDLRGEPLARRRELLQRVVADAAPLRVSPAQAFDGWDELAALRTRARGLGVEGLMLKRAASAYGIGRTTGDWWKWKLDPYSVDAVLVYAQRGHGRRASLYTDYTFAVWNDERELVPFAKAYSGLDDAQIRRVDEFVRRNTREKFGPVRSVAPALVVELAFEGIRRSPRHKSGVAVRFPRMLRVRDDKRVEDADTLSRLRALIDAAPGGIA